MEPTLVLMVSEEPVFNVDVLPAIRRKNSSGRVTVSRSNLGPVAGGWDSQAS